MKPAVQATVLAIAVTLSATNIHAEQASTDTGQAQAEVLAHNLQNPLANLISMPIQSNWDFGIGQADAMRYTAIAKLSITDGY